MMYYISFLTKVRNSGVKSYIPSATAIFYIISLLHDLMKKIRKRINGFLDRSSFSVRGVGVKNLPKIYFTVKGSGGPPRGKF